MDTNRPERPKGDAQSVVTALTRASTTNVASRGWSKLKSLDGKSRIYTFSVLSTIGLGIAMVYFDIGIFESEEDEALLNKATAVDTLGTAGRHIIRAMVLLILCVVIGLTAFFMIGISIYPFSAKEKNRHIRWLVFSFFAWILTNTMVVGVMLEAQDRYQDRRRNNTKQEAVFPHYFLLSCLVLSTIFMDFLFIMAFVESEEDIDEEDGENGMTSVGPSSRSGLVNRTPRPTSYALKIRNWIGDLFNAIMRIALLLISMIIKTVHRLSGLGDSESSAISCAKTLDFWSQDISDIFLDCTDVFWSSCLFQSFHAILSFLTWGMWKSIGERAHRSTRADLNKPMDEQDKRGSCAEFLVELFHMLEEVVRFWRELGANVRCRVDTLYEDIREDEEYKHSAWVLAAMGTSFALLVYFGVGLSYSFSGYLEETYIPRRDCAVDSMEQNGQLGDFMFRLAGFTETAREESNTASRVDEQVLSQMACSTDLIDLIPGARPGEQIRDRVRSATTRPERNASEVLLESAGLSGSDVSTALFQSRLFQCSTEQYSEESCLFLAIINRLENTTAMELNETMTPTEVFKAHGIGRTIYVFDRIVRHLVWAIWLGLMAGLAVGMFSLLSVLAQYKRFSLAIRSGFFTDRQIPDRLTIEEGRERNIRRVLSIIRERRWRKIIKLYPMGASVFFFGILVSTAIIQLVVFGGAVAFLIAFVASIFDQRVFAILRPYLGLLIAFLITWLINGPIAQICSRVFLVQNYKVVSELGFLVFLLIYTTVHLVLGVFFALMRLVWVLLTTIASLNRLDQNLFPMLKQNDLGHKSFMSMVLMQHAFSYVQPSVPVEDTEDEEVEDRGRGSEEPSPMQSPTVLRMQTTERNSLESVMVNPDLSATRDPGRQRTERSVTFQFEGESTIGHGRSSPSYLDSDYEIGQDPGSSAPLPQRSPGRKNLPTQQSVRPPRPPVASNPPSADVPFYLRDIDDR